jgi:hypothetical protein
MSTGNRIVPSAAPKQWHDFSLVDSHRRLFTALRSPFSICRTVRTRQYDLVAIEITKPYFPMIRASVSIGWIAITGQDDLRLQRLGPCNSSIDVAYLEPEKQTIPRRHIVRIADASMMMLFFPAVKLKYQQSAVDEPFVVGPAVVTLAVEQFLIPAAAGLDISDAN